MDTQDGAIASVETADAIGDVGPEKENLFKPMVPEARSFLRSIMLNSRDVKLGVAIAQDILDRAGEVKKQEQRAAVIVNITDSQVNMLAQVAQEVENARGKERIVSSE